MTEQETILLVEDDRIDVMTVKRALKEINVANPLHVASNGVEALDFLRDPANPHPAIILLDLNMPKMNGIEFLKVVKQDEGSRRIPVIVLTTSHEDQDRLDSFNFGVAGYMLKPVDYRKFVDVMRTIKVYWSLSELAG